MSWDGRRRNVEIWWVAAATAATLLVWTWVISGREDGDAPYIWIPFWAVGGLGAALSIPVRLRTSGFGLILETLAATVLIMILVVIMMASIGDS
jgi:hypothetical protein